MMARNWRSQKGMTLLEVLVTLGVMSVIFIGTLEFYSSSYAFLRGQEAKSNALEDANRIMTLFAEDIRGAEALLPDFTMNAPRTLVAAFQMRPNAAAPRRIVTYSLDQARPATLLRSVYSEERETFFELSSDVHSLSVSERNGLISVLLALDLKGTGRASTYEVASAYAMKLQGFPISKDIQSE